MSSNSSSKTGDTDSRTSDEDFVKVDISDKAAMIGAQEEPLGRRYLKILYVVSLYWFVSITMVFVNKSLLSGHENFNAPFFVTW